MTRDSRYDNEDLKKYQNSKMTKKKMLKCPKKYRKLFKK